MKFAYFIEVLSRTGEVERRQGLSSLPIRLGRGYDNDFILDDIHSAAHHAVVDLDATGRLGISDLGSRNGLIHQGKRHDHLRLEGNSVVRLGQTSIRIRPVDFEVGPEIFDDNNYGWEGWPPAISGLVVISLLTIFGIWLSSTEKFTPVHYLMALAPLFAGAMLWCGVWGFANRLFGGHARFGRHLFIAASGLLAAELWSFLSAVVAFSFSLELLTRYGNHIFVAIAVTTLYFHLSTIKHPRGRRLLFTMITLAALGSGLVLMVNHQRNGRLADEFYMSRLFTPALRLSKDHSVDEFMAGADKLKAQVDQKRKKDIAADASDEDDSE